MCVIFSLLLKMFQKMTKILLINPPIYDFSAYDFWLKPYGLLRIAGFLHSKADLTLFDYLDRLDERIPKENKLRCDQWNRGQFYSQIVSKPAFFVDIPRYFRRFGLKRQAFQKFLTEQKPFDFALVQTVMTYWYLGVSEVIEDIRRISPQTKIVLGGLYTMLCKEHSKGLDADLVVKNLSLQHLWDFLDIEPDLEQVPFWQGYKKLEVGVLKLTDGCPFKCTYCVVPKLYPKFVPRKLELIWREFELLCDMGVKNIAFYDDALLFQAEQILIPFLEKVIESGVKINFHTPNALHARFVNKDLAELMVQAGFKTFYLGFESASKQWQASTGGKVCCNELATAVKNLRLAGADAKSIAAYQIVGHPVSRPKDVEESMRFVNSLGIRIMLADFSPIPATPDGELGRQWVDMDEPLWHNKTAFPILVMGNDKVNHLKDLCRQLNQRL